MANLNKIILIGRLASDPDVRTTMDTIPIAKFQLSVDRARGGSSQKEADVIDIIAWRNLAELSKDHLKKGSMALVEGRIQNRSYETKDGLKRYATEVVANNIVILEKGVKVSENSRTAATEKAENTEDSLLEDDLPF